MKAVLKKQFIRARRHKRLRNKIVGTAARPRLTVFRSTRHIYCQLIDDFNGVTLAASSTMSPDLKDKFDDSGNAKAAVMVGKAIAEKAKDAGITTVVFDRGSFKFHGRIKALADAARKGGLIF